MATKSRFHSILLVFFIILTSCNSMSQDGNDPAKSPLENLTAKIESDDDNAELYHQRALLYQQKGDLNLAIADVQMAIQFDNKNYDYYILLADLYLASNQIQGTINSMNSVLMNEPAHIEANLKMAELNLLFKRYNEAVKSANNVLNADPYNARAHFIKGFTFKEFGDTAKAIGSYLEAVKQNPEFYNAFVELGIIFREKNDPIAVTYFTNAIQVDPKKTDSYYNLGIYYQNNGLLNEAQDVYRILIEVDPSFPYSYFNMGFILLEISNVPDEAAPYFAKAIQHKPDYFEAHYNLGLCFERMGDMQKAYASYQNALKYQTNYPKAIEALNRVDEILKR